MNFFVCGLDLGQSQDFTAMVIAQCQGTNYDPHLVGLPMIQCDVRFIHRYDLGTPYKDIAVDVGERLKKVPKPNYLVVDETGVGRPVVEMLGYLKPYGITITGSGEPTLVSDRHARAPKRNLVAAAQVALQNKILRIAKMPNADILVRELLAFRAKISDAGHDTYSAWREKDHDDLVLACSMAVWFAREVLSQGFKRELERRVDELTDVEYQISPV